MILKDDFILSAIIQSTKSSYFNSIQSIREWPFTQTLSMSQLSYFSDFRDVVSLSQVFSLFGFILLCFNQQILLHLSKTESVAIPDQYWCTLIILESCLPKNQPPGSTE